MCEISLFFFIILFCNSRIIIVEFFLFILKEFVFFWYNDEKCFRERSIFYQFIVIAIFTSKWISNKCHARVTNISEKKKFIFCDAQSSWIIIYKYSRWAVVIWTIYVYIKKEMREAWINWISQRDAMRINNQHFTVCTSIFKIRFFSVFYYYIPTEKKERKKSWITNQAAVGMPHKLANHSPTR